METTITFPNYRREAVRLDDPNAATDVARNDYEGLSGFNIPVSAEITVDPSTDKCVFTFEYTDDEEGDGTLRALPGEADLHLVLGKNTKKVIEVHLDSASAKLSESSPSFDPRLAMYWAKDLPPRQAKILVRNMIVISNILEAMPDNFRRHLYQLLTGRLKKGETR